MPQTNTKTNPATAKKKPGVIKRVHYRAKALRARRPHKSFQLTRRRDIPKHPPLPGFFSFTASVFKFIRSNLKVFSIMLAVYLIASILLIGVMQFQQYQYLRELLDAVDPAVVGSQWPILSRGLGMFGTAITGGLNSSLGETQQLYLGLIYLVSWLVVVWWLRQRLADNVVRVRDALYNGCAPFISTLLILLLMIAQALPGALSVYAFSMSTQMGIEGAGAMLLAILGVLLALLSLYWLTSSVFALLIVTLPGTYPMMAIRSASDLAVGRRLSLMLRLLWVALLVLIIWAVILIPIILLDNWINVSWSPLVPLFVQILSGVSLLFSTTYIYLLYRRMIDEPAK